MNDRDCAVLGCGHGHQLQCLLMSIASGGMRRTQHSRRTAPYGSGSMEIIDEAFHERAGLWEELQTTIGRLSKSAGSAGTGARTAETPLPYHDRASLVAHRMRNELATWVRIVVEEHSNEELALPADRVPAMARWLASHPSLFTFDMVSGVTSVVRDAERVIDRAPDRVYAGPCLEPLTYEAEIELARDPAAEVDRCAGQLYASKGKGAVRCRECGIRHDVSTRRDWLSDQLGPSLVTAAEAAPVLSWLLNKDVKVATIWNWKRHGRIEQRGTYEGRPAFRFNEVLQLAVDVQTRDTKPRVRKGSTA